MVKDTLSPGKRNPAITISNGPSRPLWESSANMDWRIGLPERFWASDHRAEVDELAMILSFFLGPYLLHGLNGLAQPVKACGKDGAVVLHLILIPATANAEQKAATAHLVERGDKLGSLDGVALRDKCHTRGDFNGTRRLGDD